MFKKLIILAAIFLLVAGGLIITQPSINHNKISQNVVVKNAYLGMSNETMKILDTLSLNNGTLLNGRVNLLDGFSPFYESYDSSNNLLYVATNQYIFAVNISLGKVISEFSLKDMDNYILSMEMDNLNSNLYILTGLDMKVIGQNDHIIGSYNFTSNSFKPIAMSFDNITGNFYIVSECSINYNISLFCYNTQSNKLKFINSIENKQNSFGASPYITYDYQNNIVYIFQQNETYIYNLTDGHLKTITLPYSICLTYGVLDYRNDYIYISNNNNITVLNTADNSFIGNISKAASVAGTNLVYDPYYNEIYSVNSSNIMVTSGLNLSKEVKTGSIINKLEIYGPYIFALNSVNSTLTIIYKFNFTKTVVIGFFTQAMAYDSSNKQIYVANLYDGSISLIGPNNEIDGNVTLNFTIDKMAYDNYDQEVAVIGSYNDSMVIAMIKNKQIVIKNDTSVYPELCGIAVNSETGYIYVSLENDFVMSINPYNLSYSFIKIGGSPSSMVYNEKTNEIEIFTKNDTRELNGKTITKYFITYLNNSSVVKTLTTPNINSMIYSYSLNETIAAGNNAIFSIKGNNISYILNFSLCQQEFKDFIPVELAYDLNNSYLYVSGGPIISSNGLSQGAGGVLAINLTSKNISSYICFNSTAVEHILLYNPSNSLIYYSHPVFGAISIISGYKSNEQNNTKNQYNIMFVELNLTPGASWSVNINGQNYTTKSNSINITVSNGSYSYSAYSEGYKNIYGNVTVNSLNQTITLTFTNIKYNSGSNYSELIIASVAVLVIAVFAIIYWKFFYKKNL
ncbi:YncE family protein [Caldiplasma sukawensis]